MTRAEARFAGLVSHGSGADLKAGTVRGGAYALAAEGLDFFLRLASIVFLARMLLPEYFGLISMATALTAIADRFKDLGLQSATIQSPTITHKQASTLFWVNTGVGAALMTVAALTAAPIARFYADDRVFFITLALATAFIWTGASTQHYALLRRTLRYREIAATQIVSSALSVLVAAWMAWHGYGYWALVGRELSSKVFVAVGTWASFPWVPGPPSRDAEVVRMLKFGADLTAFNLIYFLSVSLDQILIGRLFGAHQLGFYRQGFQLVLVPMNQVAYPVRVVTESALSRLQADPDAYRRYFRSILSALACVTFPLGLFMAVYAADIVRVVLGSQWHDATPIFRIMAVAAVMQPVAGMAGAVMVTCGHSRRFFWLGLLSSGTLAAFFVAGIPFGLEGIASAHIWSLWLLLVPKLYWSFKGTPISLGLFFSTIARPAAASVAMLMALLVTGHLVAPGGTIPRLELGAVVAAVAYLGTLVATPGGRTDLHKLVVDLSGPLGFVRLLPKRLQPQSLS